MTDVFLYLGHMASYYDEHDCRPLEDGEHPNHLLHLARFVVFLWSPYGIGQTIIFLQCGFFFLSSFFLFFLA